MKKSLLAAVAMTLALAACSQTTDSASTAPSSTSSEVPAATSGAPTGTPSVQ